MNFEGFSADRKGAQEDLPEKKIEKTSYIFAGLERVGDALLDKGKKIAYPLAFIGSLMSYELAHGVEIPKDATLEAGIELLQKGSVEDGFETGATYMEATNGRSVWYSTEGEKGSATAFGSEWGREYDDKIQIIELLEGINASRDAVIEIRSMHNHPTPEGESMPPSGFGFSGAFSDTGRFRADSINEFWQQFQEETGYTITLKEQVVDSQGVWTFSTIQDPKESNLYYEFTRGIEIAKQVSLPEESDLSQEELKELNKELDPLRNKLIAAREHLIELQFKWVEESKGHDVEELMQTDLYKDLTEAYFNVGVVVTYEPSEK